MIEVLALSIAFAMTLGVLSSDLEPTTPFPFHDTIAGEYLGSHFASPLIVSGCIGGNGRGYCEPNSDTLRVIEHVNPLQI